MLTFLPCISRTDDRPTWIQFFKYSGSPAMGRIRDIVWNHTIGKRSSSNRQVFSTSSHWSKYIISHPYKTLCKRVLISSSFVTWRSGYLQAGIISCGHFTSSNNCASLSAGSRNLLQIAVWVGCIDAPTINSGLAEHRITTYDPQHVPTLPNFVIPFSATKGRTWSSISTLILSQIECFCINAFTVWSAEWLLCTTYPKKA